MDTGAGGERDIGVRIYRMLDNVVDSGGEEVNELKVRAVGRGRGQMREGAEDVDVVERRYWSLAHGPQTARYNRQARGTAQENY